MVRKSKSMNNEWLAIRDEELQISNRLRHCFITVTVV